MQSPPPTERVRVALDKTSGREFENFMQAFLAAQRGAEYRPLGGMHDGGADGVISDTIFVHTTRSSHFMQASTEQDPASKIRATIDRLREVERTPTQLLYATNQSITRLDQYEEQLQDRFDIVIRILDRNYIVNHVPTSAAIVAAYFEHLHHHTLHLDGIGRGTILTPSAHIREPHVYTYLAGQVRTTDTESTFADGVIDALILFALEGTDPDRGILKSEDEIREKIVSVLPAAAPLLESHLRDRPSYRSRKRQTDEFVGIVNLIVGQCRMRSGACLSTRPSKRRISDSRSRRSSRPTSMTCNSSGNSTRQLSHKSR